MKTNLRVKKSIRDAKKLEPILKMSAEEENFRMGEAYMLHKLINFCEDLKISDNVSQELALFIKKESENARNR